MEEQQYTRLLNDKYRLGRKIAQGGMSSVYLCTHTELSNTWIAKHIDEKYSGLIYEEEILKKLNHISLPKIIDICKDKTGIYIIESYIEGVSLHKKLQQQGSFRPEKAIDYALQLCEVLIYLHNMKPRAIVHRDLKPSNIIVTEYEKLVLIDFGISTEQGDELKSVKAGTGAYSAPEQLINAEGSDTKADIYSYGILLHQLLTGQLPGQDNLSGVRKPTIIYDRLLGISSRCCRFRAEERYQRVEDIQKDLMLVRDKCVLHRERSRLKRIMTIIVICLLSIANYICFVLGLVYYRG